MREAERGMREASLTKPSGMRESAYWSWSMRETVLMRERESAYWSWSMREQVLMRERESAYWPWSPVKPRTPGVP
jgi:hypothetical protein